MKNISLLVVTILLAAPLLMGPASNAHNNETVTFAKDIAPIFFKNCVSCHRAGEAAPMSLLSYKDARPWAKSIREKVADRTMPPWHADPQHGDFVNDRRLTQQEIDKILAWVDGGAKEGDARDLPPQPTFVEGWSIGKPDLVLSMPEEFTLDATGPDEYHYFAIETNFAEDRYLLAAEARPGNRKIVHHIVAFVQPPQAGSQNGAVIPKDGEESIMYSDGRLLRVKADAPVHNDGCQLPNGGGGSVPDGRTRDRLMPVLTVFAPGGEADRWEEDAVMRIPAGAKIILQIHYTKVASSVQKDRSSIGLIFAKKPHTKLRSTDIVANLYIQIPPGQERQKSTACWTFGDRDVELSALRPHMHFRGAAMEVRAVYPDGRTEVLLNVPKYDFSWQEIYRLKERKVIPKGTIVQITGYFDNSSRNKSNPDPARAVRWGEPTSDEMLSCFLEYTYSESRSMAPPKTETH